MLFLTVGACQKYSPEQELKESYEYEGKTYGTRKAIGVGIYLRHVWGTMVPAFYKDPKENHTSYAYTWVYSPKDQEVGLWAEFQNYSRSEMDLTHYRESGIIKAVEYGLMIKK